MVTWLMRRAIGAFERKWNYDARYLYDILEASPRAAQLFWSVASLGQYRRDIPIEAWSAAGIMAGPRRHQQRLANNRVGFSRLPGKHGRGNTGAAADDPSGEEAPTSATAEQTDVTESTQCIVAERVLEVSLNVGKGVFLDRPRKLAQGLLAFRVGAPANRGARAAGGRQQTGDPAISWTGWAGS
jgi:hypothetical protein